MNINILPSARAFACPATERSLIEFRYHSLKASTIVSWSLHPMRHIDLAPGPGYHLPPRTPAPAFRRGSVQVRRVDQHP